MAPKKMSAEYPQNVRLSASPFFLKSASEYVQGHVYCGSELAINWLVKIL